MQWFHIPAAALGCALVISSAGLAGDEDGHYAIRLHLDPATSHLNADITITLPVDQAREGAGFFLGDRFTLEAISTDSGGRITLAPESGVLPGTRLISVEYPDDLAEPAVLRVAYSGELNISGDRTVNALTAAGLELRVDFMWLPTVTGINLQYTADAQISGLPDDWTIVTQGEAVRDDEGVVHVHRNQPDIDFVLVAAPGLERRSAPGVHVYARDFDFILTDIATRHAALSVEWLQDWMGPLPYGDVSLTVLPEGSGAYARRGYIVMSEGRAQIEAMEEELPEWGPARLVAHEFAHAWWSPADAMTEHYWLTESVAEYVAVRYVEDMFDVETANIFWEAKRERALASGPLTGGDRRGSGNALYQRGPMLLQALEHRVGREALDRVIGRLAPIGPRLTQQFLDVLAEEAGPEAASWFDAQLASGPGPWDGAEETEDADQSDR
ncbi:hypothetical protein [Glycocaulis sp.]|uniref:hypothetical protein n=1 Tax=Glycocaulis sp. TaxID=1969725 RepID=UPI003D214657